MLLVHSECAVTGLFNELHLNVEKLSFPFLKQCFKLWEAGYVYVSAGAHRRQKGY